MGDYVALAITLPSDPVASPPVLVARARTLTALTRRVRALAPAVALTLYTGPLDLYCAGHPICGAAREPGRIIYLCAPAPAGHGWADQRAAGA